MSFEGYKFGRFHQATKKECPFPNIVSRSTPAEVISDLEQRLRPYKGFDPSRSTGGFLGENESLLNVLDRDEKRLRELGLTYESIAQRISNGRYTEFQQRGGYQFCPWGDTGELDYAGHEFEYTDPNTRLTIRVPRLLVHLIRVHHFFEGFETSYRFDLEYYSKVIGITRSDS